MNKLLATAVVIASLGLANAMAATGSASSTNSAGSLLVVALAIAYSARRREIGGWLLYYYMQLYGSALVSAVFFATSVEWLSPDGWDSSSRYVLALLSALPVRLVLAVEAFAATYLLFRRTQISVNRLRMTLAALVLASALALSIDLLYFKQELSVMLDALTLFFAIVWYLYFWKSNRVRVVFIEHRWDLSSNKIRSPKERQYLRKRAILSGAVTFVVSLVVWGVVLGEQKPDASIFAFPAMYAFLAAVLGWYLPIRNKKRNDLAAPTTAARLS